MNSELLPKVTIVIPSYNHEKFLVKCIESIIDQTYKDIQVIVIDDCSIDNSPQIIKDIALRYDIEFILKDKNRGLVDSINLAFQNFELGKYICFLASDDVFVNTKVEKQVSYLEKNPGMGFVYSRTFYINEKDIIWGKSDNIYFNEGYLFDDLFLGKFHIPPMTIMYQTKVLAAITPIPNHIYNEDKYISLKLSERFKIGFIDEYLTYYRKHNENASSDVIATYKSSLQIIELYKGHNLYNQALSNQALYWFSSLSKNHKKEALKWVFLASRKFYSKFYISGILNLLGLPLEKWYLMVKRKQI